MLSIIVPIYKKGKTFERFMKLLTAQTDKKFEVIFVIDTKLDDVVHVYDDFSTKLKFPKLVYASKRRGRVAAIEAGIKNVSENSSHVLIISPSVEFDTTFTKHMNALVKKYQDTDMIEFNFSFKKPFKFHGKIRQEFQQPVDIIENREVLAYMFPIEFNKLISVDVWKQIIKTENNNTINSAFSIEHIYKALFFSKTYASVKKDYIVKDVSEHIDMLNPIKILQQWNGIVKLFNNYEHATVDSEIQFARFYHSAVFVFGLVEQIKSKVLTRKAIELMNKVLENELENFFELNIYLMSSRREAKILRKYRDANKFNRLAREIYGKPF